VANVRVDRHAGIGPDARRLRHHEQIPVGLTVFLVAAFASFLPSIALWFTDHREEGVFVGLWVPSILAAGGFWMAAVRTR
jgi:hypothetical protein